MWFKNYIARKVREQVSAELTLKESREKWATEETERLAPWEALLTKCGSSRWQIHEAALLGKLSSEETATMNEWIGHPSWEHTQICLHRELIRGLIRVLEK